MRAINAVRGEFSVAVHDYIPADVQEKAVSMLGESAPVILEEIALAVRDKLPIPAPPLRQEITDSGADIYGTLVLKDRSYKSDDELSYQTIDDMLRCGQVLFALAIKQSAIGSVLRNARSWRVDCPDERMAEAVRGIMTRVFRRHRKEMLEYMPYGAAFFEKVWDYQPAANWGMENLRGQFYGYHALKAIHPKSIKYIRYLDDGHTYNGFVQEKTAAPRGEIVVEPDLSLVLTYDKKWRNLWGRPALDAVYPYWFWLEVAIRSFLRHLERTGTPVCIVYAPSRGQITAPDGTVYPNMKYALLQAGYIAKSNAASFPSDVDPESGQKLWEVSYLSDNSRGDQFVNAIERLGTMITRSLVIGDKAATQEGAVGSYAMAGQHWEVTQLHNQLVLDELLEQVNDFVVEPIRAYNGTNRTPPAVIQTEGLDEEHKRRLMSVISIAGNQVGAALKYVDWSSIFQACDIPTLTKEEVDEVYDEELKRTVDRNKALAKAAPQGGGAPMPKGGGPTGQNLSPEAQQKVQQSADYLLFELARGAVTPFVLTQETAQEVADRYGERPFMLYNPYHDELGRFSSKTGAVSVVAMPDGGFLADAVESLSDKARDVFAAPAEFFARKDSTWAKLARAGVELATDIGINRAVSALLFSKASVLGAAATAAVSAALFGAAAPPAILAIGGIAFGIGATLVVAEILDYAQTKVFHAYVNRYAPQDNRHVQLTGISTTKKARKIFNWGTTIYGGFWRIVGIGMGRTLGVGGELISPELQEFIESVGETAGEAFESRNGQSVALEDGQGMSETQLVANVFWPHVVTVFMEERVERFEIPYVAALADWPGMKRDGEVLYIDKAGAVEFIKAWANGSFPELEEEVSFGDTRVTVADEKQLEVQLFNPYHDELGRFATRTRAAYITKASIGAGDINLTDKEVTALQENVEAIQDDLDKAATGPFSVDVEPTHSFQEFRERTNIPRILSRHVLGLTAEDGKLYLSPAVVESLAGRDKGYAAPLGPAFSAKDWRKLCENVVAHETFHSREREFDIPFEEGNRVDPKKYGMFIEEGCTELLTNAFSVRTDRMTVGDVYRLATYKPYVYAIAKEARTRYPDSASQALSWVASSHGTGFTPDGIGQSFGNTFAADGGIVGNGWNLTDCGGSWSDVKWILGAAGEVKLQEEEEAAEPMGKDLYALLLDGKLEEAVALFKSQKTPENFLIMSEFIAKTDAETRAKLEKLLGGEEGESDEEAAE